MKIHTLGDTQKAQQSDTTSMRLSNIVVDISYRKVSWPILIVTCGHQYGGFVTPKYNGHKDRTASLTILCNDILDCNIKDDSK